MGSGGKVGEGSAGAARGGARRSETETAAGGGCGTRGTAASGRCCWAPFAVRRALRAVPALLHGTRGGRLFCPKAKGRGYGGEEGGGVRGSSSE